MSTPTPYRAPRHVETPVKPGRYMTRGGDRAKVWWLDGRLIGEIDGVDGPQLWNADGTHHVHEVDDLMRSLLGLVR